MEKPFKVNSSYARPTECLCCDFPFIHLTYSEPHRSGFFNKVCTVSWCDPI